MIELTQEQFNALSIDEQAEYVAKLADKIVKEQDELLNSIPSNAGTSQ